MPRLTLPTPTDYQLRLTGTVFLGLLLCVQVLALLRTPKRGPSIGELAAAGDGERRALLEQIPLVRVAGGDVTVDGSVSVDGPVEAVIVQ